MRWLPPLGRTRGARPRRARPRLEALEDRTLLNNRFVVPAGAPVDNKATFATLQAALTTAGLATGDTIQIEPGSAPGNVAPADFTTAFTAPVTSLTIQGDPAVGASGIPPFTVSDHVIIDAADTLNLKNVSVGVVTAGSLAFLGNATIAGSVLVDVNSTSTALITYGGTTFVLTNSTLVNNAAVRNVVLDVLIPAAGSRNLISGNTFVTNAAALGFIDYVGGQSTAVTDKVVNNTFIANAPVSNMLSVQQPGITGLTIQNNTLTGAAEFGISLIAAPQNLQILGNTINLTGANPDGIQISSGGTGTTAGVTVSNNVLNTGGTGTGLDITGGGGTLNASVQGNDLHNNAFGVFIDKKTGALAGIDLGGGSQGSLGGNNFRSFTAPATVISAAIATNATAGTVSARNNLFAVADPQTVVFAKSGATVSATALPANAAFVDVLFEDFLRRPGDTANPNDAGGWAALLDRGAASPAAVAKAIATSPEALGVIVDALFLKVLGRSPDAAGRAGFVRFLQNGGTLEQAVTGLVTTPEYNALTGSDGGFVQSLYTKLLGRVGSAAEVAGWLAALPNLGRAGVAGALLASGEFRTGAVQQLFGFLPAPAVTVASVLHPLLHRAPAASEVSAWVNSGLDVDAIALAFAATPEFFGNG